MSRRWPGKVWDAINRLAELDLAHYDRHVFDREAFLGKARAKRADQHKDLIDRLLFANPDVTVDEIVAACNPTPIAKPDQTVRTAAAQWKLYELNDQKRQPLPAPPADCPTCANTGIDGTDLCTCTRGRFRNFVRNLSTPQLAEGA